MYETDNIQKAVLQLLCSCYVAHAHPLHKSADIGEVTTNNSVLRTGSQDHLPCGVVTQARSTSVLVWICMNHYLWGRWLCGRGNCLFNLRWALGFWRGVQSQKSKLRSLRCSVSGVPHLSTHDFFKTSAETTGQFPWIDPKWILYVVILSY